MNVSNEPNLYDFNLKLQWLWSVHEILYNHYHYQIVQSINMMFINFVWSYLILFKELRKMLSLLLLRLHQCTNLKLGRTPYATTVQIERAQMKINYFGRLHVTLSCLVLYYTVCVVCFLLRMFPYTCTHRCDSQSWCKERDEIIWPSFAWVSSGQKSSW